ncbi:hypothetical protein ABT301_29670 [Streptomyces sp. NPDC000987]|uniref:hypothetical protein n=1 Tax=Streptomyces sp. NPDC000987 TaxID=3154374 RepID=UPI00332BB443
MDTTTHYRFPNGDLAQVTVSDGITFDSPEGTEALTPEEYAPLLADAEARLLQHVEELEAMDRERGRTVYSALVSSGIPPEAARILSGYTPPAREG